MSTTLLNAQIQLSKDIGDYWASTATSDGAAGGTTIVDTALMSKNDDWIDNSSAEMYDLITSGTYINESKRIASLSNTAGTLTMAAHGGKIVTGVTYQIHRLFSPTDKKLALIQACRDSYPYLYKHITDDSKIAGNWLKDGSFEVWTSSSALTYWTTTTSTLAKTTTVNYLKHGNYSCKLSTAAGNIKQSITNNQDLQSLAGKTVTFSIQGWCDTASALRIGIYDGTTYTYSDYHDGDSAWTEDTEPLEVTANIQDNPTVVEFYIYLASATANAYVDDARVTGPFYNKVYIGDLEITRNEPNRVLIYRPYSYFPAKRLWSWKVEDGWLYSNELESGMNLKIEGMGVIDFLLSGVSSDDWTATVDIDQPQLGILTGYAAINLFKNKIIPTFTAGESNESQLGMVYLQQELASRISKHRMFSLPITRKY